MMISGNLFTRSSSLSSIVSSMVAHCSFELSDTGFCGEWLSPLAAWADQERAKAGLEVQTDKAFRTVEHSTAFFKPPAHQAAVFDESFNTQPAPTLTIQTALQFSNNNQHTLDSSCSSSLGPSPVTSEVSSAEPSPLFSPVIEIGDIPNGHSSAASLPELIYLGFKFPSPPTRTGLWSSTAQAAPVPAPAPAESPLGLGLTLSTRNSVDEDDLRTEHFRAAFFEASFDSDACECSSVASSEYSRRDSSPPVEERVDFGLGFAGRSSVEFGARQAGFRTSITYRFSTDVESTRTISPRASIDSIAHSSARDTAWFAGSECTDSPYTGETPTPWVPMGMKESSSINNKIQFSSKPDKFTGLRPMLLRGSVRPPTPAPAPASATASAPTQAALSSSGAARRAAAGLKDKLAKSTSVAKLKSFRATVINKVRRAHAGWRTDLSVGFAAFNPDAAFNILLEGSEPGDTDAFAFAFVFPQPEKELLIMASEAAVANEDDEPLAHVRERLWASSGAQQSANYHSLQC